MPAYAGTNGVYRGKGRMPFTIRNVMDAQRRRARQASSSGQGQIVTGRSVRSGLRDQGIGRFCPGIQDSISALVGLPVAGRGETAATSSSKP
jgi:hypothetical protein